MADLANSLIKSSFIARYGPGRAGIGVMQKAPNASANDRIWFDVDGTKRPINTDYVVTLTTTRAILAKESGTKFILNSATSFTSTLPAASHGLEYLFYVQIVGTSTGHIIAVPTGVVMNGKVISATDTAAHLAGVASAGTAGKGRILTAATGIVGDWLRVWSDGTAWYSTASGIWIEAP